MSGQDLSVRSQDEDAERSVRGTLCNPHALVDDVLRQIGGELVLHRRFLGHVSADGGLIQRHVHGPLSSSSYCEQRASCRHHKYESCTKHTLRSHAFLLNATRIPCTDSLRGKPPARRQHSPKRDSLGTRTLHPAFFFCNKSGRVMRIPLKICEDFALYVRKRRNLCEDWITVVLNSRKVGIWPGPANVQQTAVTSTSPAFSMILSSAARTFRCRFGYRFKA